MRLQQGRACGLRILIAGLLAGCRSEAETRGGERAPIDEGRLVDLTYAFDAQTIYWPTAKPFTWEKEAWGRSASGGWYAAACYAASEHGGTHLDAPLHFAERGQAADQVPLGRLIGPAAVIDITDRAAG